MSSALARAGIAAMLGARRSRLAPAAFPDLGSKMTIRAMASGIDPSNPLASWVNEGAFGDDWSQSGAARPAHASINGVDVVDFDGTDDWLQGAMLVGDAIEAAAYHGFALISVDAAPSLGAPSYLGAGICGEGTGWWGLFVRDDAGQLYVDAFHWDSGAKYSSAAIPTATPVLIEWRYDGSKIYIRAAAGAETAGTTAGSVGGGLTNNLNLGKGAGSPFLNGRIGELVICDAACSSPERAAVRAYYAATFGVAV